MISRVITEEDGSALQGARYNSAHVLETGPSEYTAYCLIEGTTDIAIHVDIHYTKDLEVNFTWVSYFDLDMEPIVDPYGATHYLNPTVYVKDSKMLIFTQLNTG